MFANAFRRGRSLVLVSLAGLAMTWPALTAWAQDALRLEEMRKELERLQAERKAWERQLAEANLALEEAKKEAKRLEAELRYLQPQLEGRGKWRRQQQGDPNKKAEQATKFDRDTALSGARG